MIGSRKARIALGEKMSFEDVVIWRRNLPTGFVNDEGQKMVVQILADPPQVRLHTDAELMQIVGRADAGQEEKVRRADGARADYDFAISPRGMELAAAPVDDAVATAFLDQKAVAASSGPYCQIAPVMCRLEKSRRRAAAATVPRRRSVGVADANQFGAGEIIVDRMAVLDGGLDKGVGQRVWRRVARNRKRSARAM